MTPVLDRERLRSIRTFPSLVKYLRDELEWPIEAENFEDLTFEWNAEELGIDPRTAAKIDEIKQLRPLVTRQPWGIFFVKFEPKRLPVVALRRVLSRLVIKKRASAQKSEQAAWNLHDLLFISNYGEGDRRQITFAHFTEDESGGVPALKVLGWDDADTLLHIDHVHTELKMKLRWPKNEDDLTAWRDQWSAAFTLHHREVITTSQALSVELARLAKKIRKRVNTILKFETDKGPIRRLVAAFREALIHDLTDDHFADMYAQTITYGLFSAACSRPIGIVADNLADMVPVTNPFLKDMLSTFLAVGGRRRRMDFDELGVQEVVELLNSPETHMDAILRDFGNRTRQEDPVIHFYEDFLREYDAETKIRRGVFYTPQPVVSYIVRSVHELLQTDFGLADGLASTVTWGEMAQKHKKEKTDFKIPEGVKPDEPFVQILDPATGTATFLVEVVDVIHKTMTAKWQKQGMTDKLRQTAWNEYVPKHLLPRLYGFELMMAPYAIAHMKLGLKLYETGYRFGSAQRANIYLTNSLEPPSTAADSKITTLFSALADESQAVNSVKHCKRFIVIIGNPPYSNFGQLNRIPFIIDLLDEYKRGLDERKLNLDDDFIKFIRFSQHSLERTGVGVFGMITNNVFIDGITHRKMRQSLLELFNRHWIVDLHGSVAKRERPPDGLKDENVFDIQQGVGITLLIRHPAASPSKTLHQDLWGPRKFKCEWLLATRVHDNRWQEISPTAPYFFFVPKDFSGTDQFQKAPSLVDCFVVEQNAVKTDRDELFIDFDRATLVDRIQRFFSKNYSKEFADRYGIRASSSFDIEARRERSGFSTRNIRTILYRPFDVRPIYYDPKLTSRPAFKVMRHMLGDGRNLALLAMRQVAAGDTYSHFLVTDTLSDNRTFYSNKGILNVFPLLLQDEDTLGGSSAYRPNFSSTFLQQVASALNLGQVGEHRLPHGITPEDIFHYAYAVFHSPKYRSRYAEFLKIDFPRLPLTSSLDLFRKLSRLGGELVALHLMESKKLDRPITNFIGSGDAEVVKVRYANETVFINADQGFAGVPEAVWNFHVGGYQVCEKWLKDRKGRRLSKDDVAHYQKIVVALNETIRLMAEIDNNIAAHGGWPGAFVETGKK